MPIDHTGYHPQDHSWNKAYTCSTGGMVPQTGGEGKPLPTAVQNQQICQSPERGAKGLRHDCGLVCSCTVLCHNAVIRSHPGEARRDKRISGECHERMRE